MKKYNLISLFLVSILSAIFLSGCATTESDPNAPFRNEPAEMIFQNAQKYLVSCSYSKAIRRYEALDSLYPFSPYSEQADLNLIYAYYQNGDAACAAAAADRFIRLFPRSCYVDYAFYMKGLSNFEQDRSWFQRYILLDLSLRDPGVARQSFDDFGMLIRMFPNSRYACDARQHMIYLRNLLACYEVHVAKYYYRRGAYVAAANRANFVIQHFDGTPSTQEALCVLIKAYSEMGLPDLANQSMQVLQYNYPHGQEVFKKLVKQKFKEKRHL